MMDQQQFNKLLELNNLLDQIEIKIQNIHCDGITSCRCDAMLNHIRFHALRIATMDLTYDEAVDLLDEKAWNFPVLTKE